jgi:hypothetical protein
VFWRSSLVEFSRAVDGWQKMQGQAEPEGMTPERYEELKAKYG